MKLKTLSMPTRLSFLIIGMAISVFLLMYTFNFTQFPYHFSFSGFDVTSITISVIIVLVGIFGSALLMGGLFGKWRFS